MCLLFLTILWIRHSDETQQEWLISVSHSICWGWNSQGGLFTHTYDSSASVVWTAGSWLRQLNWSDMSGCRLLLLAGFRYYSPCSISFIPQQYPSTATSSLVFPWGVSSSGVPWLLEWRADAEVFQIGTASEFPLKKFTNLYKILFSIWVNLRLEILLVSRFYVTLH